MDSEGVWPAPVGAYIHLPFCKKKCLYCDFPVIAVGMNDKVDKVQSRMSFYVEALLQEIAASEILNSAPLQTVFFGGGTPSLLPPLLLERILKAIDREFTIASDAEISIEADPGTFDRSLLKTYQNLGIHRLSLGVQSFEDELLATCGRAHNVADVYRAIEAVYASDMPSWSLDLMSGLPNLTPTGWQRSLEATLDADPHHVSVYDLQIEKKTPFGKLYKPGQAPLPQDEEAADMYAAAVRLLTSNTFEHYEVSNYAKDGHRCQHNMMYWHGKPFYGFGMGATSYLSGRRFARPRNLGAYKDWTIQYSSGTDRRVPGRDHLPPESEEDRLLDTIMLRLRLAEGLDLDRLAEQFGRQVKDLTLKGLRPHLERGTAVFIKDVPATVRLADPDGFLVSNDIISDVFSVLSDCSQ